MFMFCILLVFIIVTRINKFANIDKCDVNKLCLLYMTLISKRESNRIVEKGLEMLCSQTNDEGWKHPYIPHQYLYIHRSTACGDSWSYRYMRYMCPSNEVYVHHFHDKQNIKSVELPPEFNV